MKPTPHDALAALVALLGRVAMSPAEGIGTQVCIDVVKARLDQADAIENPVQPETK